jgi:hypothetical protein
MSPIVSDWNHPMCEVCWVERNGDRVPLRIAEHREVERCCWCGRDTVNGVYVREYPPELPNHRPHAEDVREYAPNG